MPILVLSLILSGHVALAAETTHQQERGVAAGAPPTSVHACRPATSGEFAQKGKPAPDNSMSDSSGFEGVQIETGDITLYELF